VRGHGPNRLLAPPNLQHHLKVIYVPTTVILETIVVVSPCNISFLNICVPYHGDSRTNHGCISRNVNTTVVVVDNRGSIVAFNFKNVTAFF